MTKITIVGGGSAQWVPILADDIAITPCLAGCELVLHDVDLGRAERTAAYARHVSDLAGAGLGVNATSDLDGALAGADFVVVCISTGGLATMAPDLETSGRFGVPLPIGDTTGPAGMRRALRNVPVLVGIARAMERQCPAAWMLNVTNPLSVLTRAVTRETAIKVVGLCHELGACRFYVSQLLDADYADVELRVAGVNHFPLVVGVDVRGDDRMADLVAVARERADLSTPLPLLDNVMAGPVVTTGGTPDDAMRAPGWTKQRLRDHLALNFEVLRNFGALPGAHPDHTIEFVPGFLNEASAWGKRWGIEPVTIADRRERERLYNARLDERMLSTRAPRRRSTELVVDVIDALLTSAAVELPMNTPNAGQCPDLPTNAIVESICVADGNGIRGRDRVHAPTALASLLRRIVTAQELTVEAAVNRDADALLAALFSDPLAGALEHDTLLALHTALLPELA
jgi:galacturan 1,4-alpha-galacturonidase